jgi:hypothetical protein
VAVVEQLAIYFDCHDSLALETLAASPYLGHIIELDVEEQGLGDAVAFALDTSPYLARLKSLRWSSKDLDRALSYRGLKAFAASSWLRNLGALDLKSEKLDDAAAQELAAWPALPHLTRLRLYRGCIGDAGMQALAGSSLLFGLRSLDLSLNRIGDAGIQALAASPQAANLTELTLWGNLIGDAGALALATSPYLAKLSRLHLAVHAGLVLSHSIGPAGLAALRARFGEAVML